MATVTTKYPLADLRADMDELMGRANPVITDREETAVQSPWYKAVRTGGRIVNSGQHSVDGGRTWSALPNKAAALPPGWRRERVTTFYDSMAGKLLAIVNAMDVDLGTAMEPSGAMANYYLRYGVSSDLGHTWSDDVVAPVPGVTRGLNAVFQGDIGCVPVRAGEALLVPANMSVLASDGKTLLSPGGNGFWFFDTVILRGVWNLEGQLNWTSVRIPGDVTKSTRGFVEPTLATLKDGRLLCLMRGSNGGLIDPKFKLPSRKWASYSGDGGLTWSAPGAWDYSSGPLVSPSSMSTLFNHSSGRVFWVGNDSEQSNVEGSLPRYPLVMLEVDSRTGQPMKSSRVVLATQTAADIARGRLDIAHAWICEDGQGRLIVTFPVNHDEYRSREWRRLVLEL